MAERLEGVDRPRRKRFYDWARWTDGATWQAREGEDFTCSRTNFQVALHQRARLQNMTVETGTPEPGIVEFRFTPGRAEPAPVSTESIPPETLDTETGRDSQDDWLQVDDQ
jgi:hypothetical protein